MISTLVSPASDRDLDAYTLISRVAAGDLAAFEALYRHYTPRLMSFLQPRLGQIELAEEVCQDVLLVVWNNAAGFQQLSSLSTWIFGIAQRLVTRAYSQGKKQSRETAAIAGMETEEESLEASLCRQRHNRRVAQAVVALPPVLRLTITLRYYHEYTYREIAVHMGCSEYTVKDRLRRAKRRLGASLRRWVHRS